MYEFNISGAIGFHDAEEKAGQIISHTPDPEELRGIYTRILSMIDLTSLDGRDNNKTTKELCLKALSFGEMGLPFPASVCIWAPYIRTARAFLRNSPISIATVGGAFPSGQAPLIAKLVEAKYAVSEGADELDIVIPRGRFLEGCFDEVEEEISAFREISEDIILKVILETGELGSQENIARASEIAIRAGADFIKTSTGKITPGATPTGVFTMLSVIRGFQEQKDRITGIKPSGGISEPEQALGYWLLADSVIGPAYLAKDTFRIGASRLADKLAAYILDKPAL
jgi:deoxyribose-phosphate aldolase